MSHLLDDYGTPQVVAALLEVDTDESDDMDSWLCSIITHDKSLTLEMLQGYSEDPNCRRLFTLLNSLPKLVERDGLLSLSDRLVILSINYLCEKLFHLGHDTTGHFGINKTYTAL